MSNMIERAIAALALVIVMTASPANSNNHRIVTSGEFLQAWNICYSDFSQIPDLSVEKKKLAHYEIEFSEDEFNYIVEFIPKIISEEQARLHNSIVIGRGMTYWIDKSKLTIYRRIFHKS